MTASTFTFEAMNSWRATSLDPHPPLYDPEYCPEAAVQDHLAAQGANRLNELPGSSARGAAPASDEEAACMARIDASLAGQRQRPRASTLGENATPTVVDTRAGSRNNAASPSLSPLRGQSVLYPQV